MTTEQEINTASHEIEAQLLGSILRDGKIFPKVRDILNADNFHDIYWQGVYRAMCKVDSAGLVVDAITTGDQLQRDNKLEDLQFDVFTGRAALGKIREIGNPKNAESYAYTVQDYWGKREINMLAGKFAMWSQNGRRSVDILADARKLFDDVDAQVGMANTRSVDAKTAASMSYDETVNASKGIIKYAKTGLIDLDAWFKMREGNLTIVAARPGKGKTALLVTIAINNARDKIARNVKGTVLFLSMEMTVEEVTARFLSQISEVPTERILDGQMTVDEWSRYNDAVGIFETLPIIINDLPAMSIQLIRTEAQRYLKDGEENLLIVDYLQLATSGLNKQNRVDEVGAVARGLKVYAGTKKTPVLAAAQLSRAIETRSEKRPVLSDLRESGNIEQDANNVIFLHDDEEETLTDGKMERNIKKIIIAKQRNGATSATKGDIEVRWNAPIMKFENLSLGFINLNPERITA